MPFLHNSLHSLNLTSFEEAKGVNLVHQENYADAHVDE
jgi:hypothetical protein